MVVLLVIGGIIAFAFTFVGLLQLSQYCDYCSNRHIGESYNDFCKRSYSRYVWPCGVKVNRLLWY